MSLPVRPLPVGEPPSRPSSRHAPELTALDGRLRPTVLARDELTPVLGAFAGVFGAPGIRRGSTVVVESAGPPGATSVALALLAAATAAGRWCAVVGLPEAGLVAAVEFGLALDRLVLIPSPPRQPAKVLAALLEGCEIVLLAGWTYPNLGETRRLAAHARERRTILLPVRIGPTGPLGRWPEPPDAAVRVVGSRPFGIEEGAGHLHSRLVELEVTRRRMHPRTVRTGIWLPAADGSVTAAAPAEIDGVVAVTEERAR